MDAAVKTHQYKVQKFETDLDFSPKDWPVTVGDLIGYMGNTGASKGAHLHFELRETNSSEVLDPAEYGVPIQDNIAPLIRRVKLYGFDSQGNESSSQIFYASKLNKSTHLISVPGDMFSLGVDALDRSNNSWNWTE
ncbi:MAG: M23 family metallopeptidase [Saprospiraceae bacterium]|nr:M23 family metallopeptidase [Saprospiraceae bacterium]